MNKPTTLQPVKTVETLDRDKLNAILIKNWLWIVLIIIVSNLTAYLTLRWTKDTFKSSSEIKLDVKSNASELGIKPLVQDENLNLISGEIEQIKSPLFLSQVVDSLDLWVSYFSVGNVLDDEMYRRSPFIASHVGPLTITNTPVYFKFSNDGFILSSSKSNTTVSGGFDQIVNLDGTKLIFRLNPNGSKNEENNYYFIINSKENLLASLLKNLTVEPLNFNANTIRISYLDHNALKTQSIVNAIDSLYLKFSNFQKNQASIQKVQWLNNELEGLEEKMGDYESYFKNFTIENRSSDLKEDLKNVIKEINQLDSQQYFLSKKIKELTSLMAEFDKKPFNSLKSTAFLPDFINKKIETLASKQKEKEHLSLSYNETTFALQQIQNEVSKLEDAISEELRILKSEWLSQAVDIDSRRKRLERTFATMPDKNTQFSKNQRYYKLYEEFYLSLMQSKAEYELAQAGSTPDFKILSPATFPKTPIAPKRAMIYAVGVVAGFVLGFFFVGLLYILNDKITSVKEIESSLSLPVLGMLPMNSLATRTPLFIRDHPKSRLSESIRNLRSNLDFLSSEKKSKVVAVSSSISGEGKSFLAQNLSGVIALSKKKVILIDLDMRKPKKLIPFDVVDNNKGVSTVLIRKDNWQDCVISTDIPSLDYMSNGPIPPNPAELLINGEFEQLLTDLKAKYDFIVLDTPPAGLVTDGVMALKKADISIYVFRCNYSRKENLRTLDRMMQINKINNLAVVFNDFIPPADNGYGYYEDAKPTRKFLKFFKS